MTRTDPRAEYDDLIVTRTERLVDAETFEAMGGTDAGQVGWSVGAVVLDGADRILLVEPHWAGAWAMPGGGTKPGESLTEAVVREVREESGIDARPIRPRAVRDRLVANATTGEAFEETFVVFEARAASTAIPEDLGATADEVAAARWFEEVPEDVHRRGLTERVYRRCLADEA